MRGRKKRISAKRVTLQPSEGLRLKSRVCSMRIRRCLWRLCDQKRYLKKLLIGFVRWGIKFEY